MEAVMGNETEKLIAALNVGGAAARDSVIFVDELLRKAWPPGFTPAFEHLEAEQIDSDDASRLREALAAYCSREPDASGRRHALSTLSKNGDASIKKDLVRELHLALEAHRVLSAQLFQVLLALENVGEHVYPGELASRGINAVQVNVEAAERYLLDHGIAVPL
jgi:hypothetical protein